MGVEESEGGDVTQMKEKATLVREFPLSLMRFSANDNNTEKALAEIRNPRSHLS